MIKCILSVVLSIYIERKDKRKRRLFVVFLLVLFDKMSVKVMNVLRRSLSSAISYAAKPLISVDLNQSATKQEIPFHNRWHPDIPSVVSVRCGETFRIECIDWTGGQIENNDSADDITYVDLARIHYLTGPIEIEDTHPGDVLVVDILDVGPLPSSMWGFTGIFDQNNGGGFLSDKYPHARKAIWDFSGIYATSRHIKNVRFAGLTHPGKMIKDLFFFSRRRIN